jgi:hypothetical protein
LTRNAYKTWLLIAGAVAILAGIVVSGSRSCVVSVLIVVFAVVIIFVFRPRAVNQFGRTLLIIVIGGLIVSRLPIFKQGVEIISNRFTESAEASDTTVVGGIVDRVLGDFTESFHYFDKYPLFGYGIGIGTNVGGRILVGQAAFLIGEREWTRVFGESGPILGMAFLAWRTLFTFYLGWLSLRALKRDSLLPILLFGAGGILMLNGQLGQPTTLGFAAFLNGLCLAATQPRVTEPEVEPIDQEPVRRVARRSPFANRIHGVEFGSEHNNGSADR